MVKHSVYEFLQEIIVLLPISIFSIKLEPIFQNNVATLKDQSCAWVNFSNSKPF